MSLATGLPLLRDHEPLGVEAVEQGQTLLLELRGDARRREPGGPGGGILARLRVSPIRRSPMPKLSTPLSAAFNAQIQKEFASAYLYLEMAARCSAANLKGTAHWLRKQWDEEVGHATKMMDYAIGRGNEVHLESLPEPEFEYRSLTDVFEHVLRHEQEVTAAINDLYSRAAQEKDWAAQAFLQWYVNEQVEEENAARDILDLLRVGGDQGAVLLMIDRQLGQRG
jgi:ferritin